MEYRSQLVVRTRDPREARIIQKVKELADGNGSSISEMALELLNRAINGEAPIMDGEDHKAARPNGESRSASSPPAHKTNGSTAPMLSLPKRTLDDTPRTVVIKAMEHLEAGGRLAAARFLAEFYESATAVDGGRVRVELTHRLTPAEYDALHDVLRETEEYRRYTRRVVDGH